MVSISIRRRKKAISKVVKLLNLATSSNVSESQMAIRHAESVISQNGLKRMDIPQALLCDVKTLYKVDWSGKAKSDLSQSAFTETQPKTPFHTRRFTEKPIDPAKAYSGVKTIIDDINDHIDVHPATEVDEETATVQASSDTPANDKTTTDKMFKNDAHTFDNVINATRAFRPDVASFADRLRDQYASSNPEKPFEEDAYWQKVHAQLVDFNEAELHVKLSEIETQQALAEEYLKEKREERLKAEQEEQNERSERARIERSFEEAIEKAFQQRAQAYEIWEKRRSEIRINCLRAEQEAVSGYEEIVEDINRIKSDVDRHQQLKEEYRAAKIMHELRKHLSYSIKKGAEGENSFKHVIEIMNENNLSLRDLEFSDIKNKSLFIKLLEHESAKIDDLDQRELYTDDMLTKFLTKSVHQSQTQQKVINPIVQIQELLVSASNSAQFESQKCMEQVFHLMKANGVSIKQLDLSCIAKYSVFVRLLNWESEQIASVHEREQFTAKILEEYVSSTIDAADFKNLHSQKQTN